MTDIFTEVEEDLRRERAKRLWNRYGWVAIAGVSLVLAGTGGYQLWQWDRARTNAQASAQYVQALRAAEAENAPQAAAGFGALARSGPAGYQLLSRLQDAAIKARANEADAATAIWQGVSADQTLQRPYRDLAQLLAAMNRADGGDAARLGALATPDSPFRFVARELEAMAAVQRDDRARAVAIFRELVAAEAAPAALRNRASEALAALGAAAADG